MGFFNDMDANSVVFGVGLSLMTQEYSFLVEYSISGEGRLCIWKA